MNQNENDVKDRPAAPEVVVAGDTALAPREVVGLAPIAMQADALEIIQRQTAIHQAVGIALIRITEPGDWIAQKVGDDVFLMPGGSATSKIAGFIQLEIAGPEGHARPVKEKVVREGTEIKGFRVTFRARSFVLGSLAGLPPAMVPWRDLETTRWADEDFTGRQVDGEGKLVRRNGVGALTSDLSGAVDSAARNRAVRQLTGLGRVPLELACRAWGKTEPQIMALVQKGHGFGRSDERAAEKVAAPGSKEDAETLWAELLRFQNGVVAAAGKWLEKITVQDDGKYAKKSIKAFTAGWQVKKAWERLEKEPEYRAYREGAAPAAEPPVEREPGEDG